MIQERGFCCCPQAIVPKIKKQYCNSMPLMWGRCYLEFELEYRTRWFVGEGGGCDIEWNESGGYGVPGWSPNYDKSKWNNALTNTPHGKKLRAEWAKIQAEGRKPGEQTFSISDTPSSWDDLDNKFLIFARLASGCKDKILCANCCMLMHVDFDDQKYKKGSKVTYKMTCGTICDRMPPAGGRGRKGNNKLLAAWAPQAPLRTAD